MRKFPNIEFTNITCQNVEILLLFLAVEQKKIYGDIVTPSEGICEDVGVLVTTRDEKTAPPKKTRLSPSSIYRRHAKIGTN